MPVIEKKRGSGKTTQVLQYTLDQYGKSRIPCGILSVFPRRILPLAVSFSNSPVDSNPRFNRTRSKINFCETCCDGSGSRLRAQSIVMPGHYKALSDFICRLVYF